MRKRVSEGGHDIPDDVIERRYVRGLKNLFALFIAEGDYRIIVNNSGSSPEIVLEAKKDDNPTIHKPDIWERIIKLK